jgi:hypothetical protein
MVIAEVVPWSDESELRGSGVSAYACSLINLDLVRGRINSYL